MSDPEIGSIVWCAVYHIQVDAVLGLPYRATQSLIDYAKRGPSYVEFITEEKAKELNDKFLKDGAHAQKFLDEQMVYRKAMIEAWKPE